MPIDTPFSATHTASIDRRTVGGTNADGVPVTTSAAGFPKQIAGSLQSKSSAVFTDRAGLERKATARFIASEYHDGRVGDTITVGGVDYYVVRADVHAGLFDAAADHAVYHLSATQPGGAP